MGQRNEDLLNQYANEEEMYDDIPESVVDKEIINDTIVEDGIEKDSEENLETSKEIDKETTKVTSEEQNVEEKDENIENCSEKLGVSEEEYNSNFEVELANRVSMGISKDIAEAELKDELSKKYFIIESKEKIREDEKEFVLSLLKRKIKEEGETQNIEEKAEEEFIKKYKVVENIIKENIKIDLYKINKNSTLKRREISIPEYMVLFNLLLRKRVIKNKNVNKSELIKEIEIGMMEKYKIEKIEISKVNYNNILKTRINEKINSGLNQEEAEMEAKKEINNVYYIKEDRGAIPIVKEKTILEDPTTFFEDIETNKAKEINLSLDLDDFKKELIEEFTKIIKDNQPKHLSKEVEDIKKEFSEIFEILNEWKKLGRDSVDNYQAELLKGASAEATVLFNTMGKILNAWRDFETELYKSNISKLLEKKKEIERNPKEEKKQSILIPIVMLVFIICVAFFIFKFKR